MNYEPIQRWADQAADTAGKMLGQGKVLALSARDRAWDAASAARRREAKRADAYLATLQDRWRGIKEGVSDRFSRKGTSLHDRMHSTERMLLKAGGLFLVFKCFSHRNEPIREVVASTRTHIEERPLGSAVIALGLGYAIGKLLR